MSYQLEMPAGLPLGTIIAVHGLMESAACLEAAFPEWTAQGFTVVAVDLRGHGRSPGWTDELLRSHPGDVMVQDLITVLASAELRAWISGVPLLFYGHSAGGGVAAAAAATALPSGASQRVAGQWQIAGVLLEDPFWRLPVTKYQDSAVAAAANATLREVKRLSLTDCLQRKKEEWPSWPDEDILLTCQAQRQTDELLVKNGHVIPSPPWPNVLAAFNAAKVPVLIVTGTDRIGITTDHQDLARRQGARVEVIEGASHFVRRDAPELFMQTASAFFDGCVSPTTGARPMQQLGLPGDPD